ncbi:helix-turn-helix domain-containing protein [Gordonia sp. TBRC 11910]|uniref:Helix-turn-helix domain-containing protein n=1 Tax=Gordonia asplenii TaxID=2725283 RepID=A0A848L014_9ACTN|nr:helix-turn-helix domain-containing protein [Gordonia asplenii]NMO03767.1 helix-turn-helix domain-containing protein [Gordonia asplenii]
MAVGLREWSPEVTGVPSVDDHTMLGRAMAIVDAIADHGCGLPLTDLAAVTGLPKPTTLRIANSLVERNILTRNAFGYALGPSLVGLGETAALQRRFERYRPILDELQRRHGGVAWLTAGPSIVRVHPIAVVCAPRLLPLAHSAWPASDSPEMLANTAGGHLALAQRPDLIDQVVARGGLRRRTPTSLRDARELAAAVARVQRDGFAVESEQCVPGWSCAAAVLPSIEGTAAVVGITVDAEHNPRDILRALGRAFEAIVDDAVPSRHSG